MIMENILPRYNINLKNDFVFIDKENLEQFMLSDLSAHSHNYYILSFLYKGTVDHLADFEHKKVSAPAILMLDIDKIHTHPDISNCNIVSIAFSRDFISDQHPKFLQIVNNVFSRPLINISSEELKELDEIIKIIARESSRVGKNYELIKALLHVLMVHCNNLSEAYPLVAQNKEGSYDSFRFLLKNNFRKQHQVKFYADTLNVSTRVLNLLIKNSTYKTPKQLIDDQLLLEAKRLLYWSDVSVKEIAWQLGFETDSYFNRFFKKHTGKTPKEFHRKHFENKIE